MIFFRVAFILSSLTLSLVASASSLQLEGSSTTSTFNYFQIPNNDSNRVDLPEKTATAYRLTAFIDLGDSASLYFLLAPLSIDYSFQSSSSFEFDGVNFSSGIQTNVTYKFNSYRFGYLWKFGSGDFKYWVGPVLKVRDAKISVTQGGQTKSFDNIGPVPLLGAGFEYNMLERLSIYLHADGLAASQGSAYDASLEIRGAILENISLAAGARILGGGADNDTLKTFAQFNSYTSSLIFVF